MTVAAKPQKPRLSRIGSVYPEGAVFFVTCATQHRRPLLADDHIHRAFAAFCSVSLANQVFVGRYVLMPDHLHLFVHLANPDELSRWIKSLKNFLSKALRQKSHEAPHWQKGFFDHLLRSEESWTQKWSMCV